MKGISKKVISILLSVAMLCTSFTVVVTEVGESNPAFAEEIELNDTPPATKEDVKKATDASAAALKEYMKTELGKSTMDKVFERLGGLGDFAYGGFTVLEMLGIIEDPTTTELKNIMDILREQSKQLNQLSSDMKELSTQLKVISIKQEQNKRAATAAMYHDRWLKYYSDYLEAMSTNLNTYKSWVIVEIRNWSQTPAKRNDIYVYYTNLNEASLTCVGNYAR